MIQYTNVNTNNRDVQEIDTAVEKVFDSLYPNPLLNNPTIIKDLVFVSGTDLVVNHKLGRVPKGYIVIKSTAAANLYTSATTVPNPTTQIILKTNANATISILFF